VLKQRGLAHAGFALDDDMSPSVIRKNAEVPSLAAECGDAEHGKPGVFLRNRELYRWLALPAVNLRQGRRGHGLHHGMPECGQLLGGEQEPQWATPGAMDVERREPRQMELAEARGE